MLGGEGSDQLLGDRRLCQADGGIFVQKLLGDQPGAEGPKCLRIAMHRDIRDHRIAILLSATWMVASHRSAFELQHEGAQVGNGDVVDITYPLLLYPPRPDPEFMFVMAQGIVAALSSTKVDQETLDRVCDAHWPNTPSYLRCTLFKTACGAASVLLRL